MSTKLVYKNICGHKTTIETRICSNGTDVTITSTCKTVNDNDKNNFIVKTEDITKPIFEINEIFEIIKNNTPTCFLPTMIMNAIWIENGLLSKSLAKKEKLLEVSIE